MTDYIEPSMILRDAYDLLGGPEAYSTIRFFVGVGMDLLASVFGTAPCGKNFIASPIGASYYYSNIEKKNLSTYEDIPIEGLYSSKKIKKRSHINDYNLTML